MCISWTIKCLCLTTFQVVGYTCVYSTEIEGMIFIVSLIVTAVFAAVWHLNLHLLRIYSSVSLLQFSLAFLVEECCNVNLQLLSRPCAF